MKSGTSDSFLKLKENKNKMKKGIQRFLYDPFNESSMKSPLNDEMKPPMKTRVPFLEILNQQELQIENKKIYKKVSNGYIPNEKSVLKISCKEKTKCQNKQNKTNESSNSKVKQIDQFTQQGKNSLQLISVIQSVTISSRSNQNKSSEIYKEKSYRLQINEQAVQKLLQIQKFKSSNEEISFCTAVGKTKTGKSFLLNKLINSCKKDHQGKTFSVNHTLASCTKGIWISNQLIDISKNDSKKSMLILDTAGFGSYDSTQQIDYKLLTLSILLSDVLMYNSIGPIDQQMLNGMSLAVEISKLISQQQQKSRNIDKIITFPALIWILRDFSLELLTKQNKKITQQQYLEKCLNTQNLHKNYSSQSNKTKSKTNIRVAIKSIFTNRKCSTLVVPFNEQGDIRNEFLEGLNNVKDKLFKLINNQQKQKQKIQPTNKIQEFIIRLRAFVDLLNEEDSNTLNSSKKGSFFFPKIESLQKNLNKVKLLHQFKKINEEYEKLFRKYQENIQKVQQTVDSKQKYLKKVLKLRQKMESEINETRIQFNQKIQKLLNLKNPLLITNKQQNIFREKSGLNETFFRINISQLEKDFSENHNLIKVVKQNYLIQSDTLRLRFQQIEHKIIQSSQSYRYNQTQQEEKIMTASKMISEKIESFSEINSLTELKKAFEKTLKDLKNLFSQSQELKQMKNLQKLLQVHYLNKKVNLMESSHLQLSNQSNFQEYSKLKNQGYDSCTNCQKSFYIPYIIIPSFDLLKIKFLKTIVREMHREYTQEIQLGMNLSLLGEGLGQIKKMKLQFIIEVQLNNKKWFIRRKLKDFIELNNIISIMFTQGEDNMVYPCIEKSSHNKNIYMHSLLKLTSLSNPNDFSQDKVRKTKQQLQNFWLQLNKLDHVRNSRIFQKFVKINKEYLDL